MFAVMGPLSQPTLALSADWAGETIRHDGQSYVPESNTTPPRPLDDDDPRGRAGQLAYTWIEQLNNGNQRAHTIYIEADDNPATEITGTLISYNYTPPNTYSSASSPQDITILADPTAESPHNVSQGECQVVGIGWAVCPLAKYLSEGVDFAYGLIREFLEVPAVTTDPETGLYAVWGIVRSVANVCLIIAILVIIYSQLTSMGISNYGIKSMLPRLIIAAILLNISFWISALAIDISNVLGYSVHAVFENIRTNLPMNIVVDWSGLTTFVLSAGTIAGTSLFIGMVGGSVMGLGYLLLSALLTAAFGVFVAFVILAARQAILTILVILSPLAFVAYILPSTRNLFDRWRKSFTTLLIFFPLFAILFGGSSLAGAVMMNNAGDRLHIVLIGLTVQFIPLVITPLLIQFSTGLLGRIAGIARSQGKEIDRAKSWARNQADYHKQKSLAGDGFGSKANPFAIGARALNRRAIQQDRRLAGYKDKAEQDARYGRQTDWRRLQRQDGVRRGWQRSDNVAREAALDKQWAESSDENRWQQRLGNEAPLRERYQAAHHEEFAAGRYKSANEAAAKLHSQRTLDARSESFDGKLHKAVIDQVETDAAQANLEANFDAIVADLKAGVNTYASDSTPLAVKARLGTKALDDLSDQAGSLKDMSIELAATQERKGSAETVLKNALTSAYKANDLTIDGQSIRKYAGGIDENGATKVYAKAARAASADHMENVEAVGSVYSGEGYNAQQMLDISQGRVTQLRDGTEVSDYHVHAAIRRVNTEIGNNWAVQKLSDFVNTQGMNYDADSNTYTDSQTGAVLDTVEVERRRDLQQIFRDTYNKGAVRVSTISQTDLSNMETGTYAAPTETVALSDGSERTMLQSEAAMVRDMNSDKYKEDRWLSEDVDVLSRYIQNLREDDIRNKVKAPQRKILANQIHKTITNPLNQHRVNGREGQLLQVIEKYLRAPDTLSLNEKQRYEAKYMEYFFDNNGNIIDQIEQDTTQHAPTEYDVSRQNDFPAGKGPR